MVRRPPRGTRIPSHKCPNLRSDVKANLNGKLFVDASFPRHTREFDDVMGVMESSLDMCFRMAKKKRESIGKCAGRRRFGRNEIFPGQKAKNCVALLARGCFNIDVTHMCAFFRNVIIYFIYYIYTGGKVGVFFHSYLKLRAINIGKVTIFLRSNFL